jgi:hypothetical protein
MGVLAHGGSTELDLPTTLIGLIGFRDRADYVAENRDLELDERTPKDHYPFKCTAEGGGEQSRRRHASERSPRRRNC